MLEHTGLVVRGGLHVRHNRIFGKRCKSHCCNCWALGQLMRETQTLHCTALALVCWMPREVVTEMHIVVG